MQQRGLLRAGFLNKMNTHKKKVYFVSTTIPAEVGGAEIRNFNIVKQLSLKPDAIELTVFGIASKDPETERVAFTSSIAAEIIIVPDVTRSFLTILKSLLIERMPPFMTERKDSELGSVFRNECEKSLPDIVQIEQLDAYYCIRPHIEWLKSKGVKIIFDCHNIEFQAFKDSLSIFPLIKKLVGYSVVPHMKKLEIEAAKQSSCIFACSETDALFFRTYNPSTQVIPNGVDCSEFQLSTGLESKTLLFIGGVKYPPNADGLEYYLREIHPLVKKRFPEVRLLMVGANDEWVKKGNFDTEGLSALGFVPSVSPYLAQSSIGICPIRYGSGTRIKIMTYMAAGIAVVSTTKGAEGVGYVPGSDILIEDDAIQFAEALMRLLENPEELHRIAEAGHTFIKGNYDWNLIGDTLLTFY